MHIANYTPRDDSRLSMRVHPSGSTDSLGVDSADLGDALGWILLRTFHQIVEADGLLLDETPVVKTLVNDDVNPPHQQSRIGSIANG